MTTPNYRNIEVTDSITLTYADDARDDTALLTVRGKDHDLDAVRIARLRDACDAALARVAAPPAPMPPKRRVVYVAGKYRGQNAWAVELNIRAAAEVAARVWAAGLVALCPHTNAAHMEGAATDEHFLAGTLELMRRCDAVILVPGWSTSEGTKAEIAEAMRLGLPVFGMEGTFDAALQRLTAWGNGTLADHDKRKCNMHDDCDAADARAKSNGTGKAKHCSVEGCEDCFGT